MPPHHTYIETHLGGGNVLERKRPAARNIGLDVAGSVIDVWRDRIPGLSFSLELARVDAAEFLRSFPFDGGELVYCDPPYLHSTRRTLDLYEHEYTEVQHVDLLETIVTLPCPVIISGYASSLYREMLQDRHGWRCVEFPNTTRRGRVIECAWTNRGPVEYLHDSRYAGATFRERERIKRKRQRWLRRFAAMPAGERQVVLEALLELTTPAASSTSSDGISGILPPAQAMGACIAVYGGVPGSSVVSGEPRGAADRVPVVVPGSQK